MTDVSAVLALGPNLTIGANRADIVAFTGGAGGAGTKQIQKPHRDFLSSAVMRRCTQFPGVCSRRIMNPTPLRLESIMTGQNLKHGSHSMTGIKAQTTEK